MKMSWTHVMSCLFGFWHMSLISLCSALFTDSCWAYVRHMSWAYVIHITFIMA